MREQFLLPSCNLSGNNVRNESRIVEIPLNDILAAVINAEVNRLSTHNSRNPREAYKAIGCPGNASSEKDSDPPNQYVLTHYNLYL